MEWEFIAPMIMTVVLILTVGGVLVLRPLTRRFAELLEVYVSDRKEGSHAELRHVRELLETMDARLQLMEDRLDFTERMLESRGDRSGAGAERIGPGGTEHPTDR